MEQLPLFQPDVLTVGELNRMARQALEDDPRLQDVYVAGEVSGITRPASGHVYFTLKDASASVRCVMWRDAASRVTLPEEGEAVEAHGHVSLYETGGSYQFYVDYLQPSGRGELFAEFLRLKAKLEAEGLFDAARKRPIPRWPKKIAVVTSPVGAAWRDVQNVLARRFPLVELLLAPTAVQGEGAPDQICAALRKADKARPDLILLVRGGGSIEDLWAFNDERVVRATAASQTPVITGVGHETDFTLADFSADLRAPTPSAAAELAAPDREELRQEIGRYVQRLETVAASGTAERRNLLRSMEIRLRTMSPLGRLQNIRQQIDDHTRRLEVSAANRIALNRTLVEGIIRVLDGISPRRVLDRGYALVWRETDGKLVRSTEQAPDGMMLRVLVADGGIRARSEGEIGTPAEGAFPSAARPSSPRSEDDVPKGKKSFNE